MASTSVTAPPPAPAQDWLAILKEAGIAAAIAFLLSLELVGIATIDKPGGLDFETRFDDVLAATLLVFFGRLAAIFAVKGMALQGAVMAGAFSLYMLAALLFGGDDGLGQFKPFASEIVCWIVTLGSIGITLYALQKHFHAVPAKAVAPKQEAGRELRTRRPFLQAVVPWLGAAFIIFAFFMPTFDFADRRILDMGILVLTYVMLGWGLNIVVGLAGLLDLGYVAFYAVGAYSYALMAQNFDLGFWACLPVAGIMAAFFGVLLGFPVLRLRGDYLAIVTLGFGEIIRVILINWWWFTGGPDGIRDIPRPEVPFLNLVFERKATGDNVTFHEYFGIEYDTTHRIIFLYYIILVLALIVNLFTLRVRKMPIGRAWEALREDETACRALGINPTNTKLTAFAIGAMFGGFGGAFFATRQGFISPESFTFIESAVILAIVVLGGLGSQVGVVIAAALLIGVPELFRELAEYRMLAFGAGMVLIMIWRPRGLLSHRTPTVRLHHKRKAEASVASEGSA